MNEKIQKVLARAGLGSRRELEQWIRDRRVSVDGRIAALGDRVESTQVIRVDGHVLAKTKTQTRRRILLYHKSEGELCTRVDPKGRPTVFDHLPRLTNGRWINVGRLDFNTAGLLLFTTDGELANRLTHPSNEIVREYAVRVLGRVNAGMLKKLQAGVRLPDGLARFESIRDAGGEGANHWYHVTLKEGRYREVRRLWEKAGVRVSRLIRIRYGPVKLPRALRSGRWEELEAKSASALLAAVGLSAGRQSTEPPNRRRQSGGKTQGGAGRTSSAPARRRRKPMASRHKPGHRAAAPGTQRSGAKRQRRPVSNKTGVR